MPKYNKVFISHVKTAYDLTANSTGEALAVHIELRELLKQLQQDPDKVDVTLFKKIFSSHEKNIDVPGYFTDQDRGNVRLAISGILKLIDDDAFLKNLFSTPVEQIQFTFEQVKNFDLVIDYMTTHPDYIPAFLQKLSQQKEAKAFIIDLLTKLILLEDKNILTQIEKSGIFDAEFDNKEKVAKLFLFVKDKGLGNPDTVEFIINRANNVIKLIPIETWKSFAKTEKNKKFLILESTLSDAAYTAIRTFDIYNKILTFIGLANTSPAMDSKNYQQVITITRELLSAWLQTKADMISKKEDSKLIDEIDAQVNKVVAAKQMELEKVADSIPNFKTEGKTSGVSFYQIQGGVLGRYAKQEDFYSFGSIPGYKDLTTAQKDQVQKDAFSIMQKKHGRDRQGSTAISGILSPIGGGKVELKVPNVGDSGIFILRVGKDGSVTAERVNPLHDADNISEQARVKKAGGVIIGTRLGGSLAVTSAMGDNDVKGIGHEPEITTTIISVNPGEKVIVLGACDGLTEKAKAKNISDVDYLKQMAEVVVQSKMADTRSKGKEEIDLTSLPSDLAKQAMRDGSTDNITVLGTEVDPKMQETLALNVFDGHGGKDVSSGLGKDYFSTVNGLTKLAAYGITELADKAYTKKPEIDALLREIADPKTDAKRKEALQFARQVIEDRLQGQDNPQLQARQKQIQIMFIRTLEDKLSHIPEVKRCVTEYYQAAEEKKSTSELQALCDQALVASQIPGIREMPERIGSSHIRALDDVGFATALKDMSTAFKAKATPVKADTAKAMPAKADDSKAVKETKAAPKADGKKPKKGSKKESGDESKDFNHPLPKGLFGTSAKTGKERKEMPAVQKTSKTQPQ